MQLTLPAPAKLNLFLHIVGRRADGYHNLQTLFQLLDYGDELTFTPRHDSAIEVIPQLADMPLENNLIYKAARLLQQHTNHQGGANIHLDKRLPMGGGLGGGSSDAATALVGLNRLWQTGLNNDELAALGRQLGADVPVFVRGQTAWGEGIGDRLTPVQTPPDWFVVIAPQCRINTGEIFSHQTLTRDTPIMKIRASFGQGPHNDWRNDCQPVVERLYPAVKTAREWLSEHAPARMTGTGACVFAGFDCRERAETVLAKRPPPLQGFVAKGVNRSPLYDPVSTGA